MPTQKIEPTLNLRIEYFNIKHLMICCFIPYLFLKIKELERTIESLNGQIDNFNNQLSESRNSFNDLRENSAEKIRHLEGVVSKHEYFF